MSLKVRRVRGRDSSLPALHWGQGFQLSDCSAVLEIIEESLIHTHWNMYSRLIYMFSYTSEIAKLIFPSFLFIDSKKLFVYWSSHTNESKVQQKAEYCITVHISFMCLKLVRFFLFIYWWWQYDFFS